MDFELRFTDKEISPWGGMALLKRMLEHIGFEQALLDSQLPPPGSNRGYPSEQLLTQFMLSVWCGANRFEHAEVTRHDAVLQRLFGFARMANFKALLRLFQRFNQPICERVFGRLYAWLFGQLQVNDLTLDLDSTVMTRYGAQQGASKGYNSAKPGRHSHHPLMAFVADTRMVANFWLRPGNSHTANNASAFLQASLQHLGGKRVRLLRADSGFSEHKFLCDLEQRQMHFIVALRLQQPLQRALASQAGWWTLDEGIELTSFDYQSASWDHPRRVVGIRQHAKVRAQAKGKTLSLFADDPVQGQYRYGALVTDLDLPAQEVWRTYRGRADCENRIKELKYDFAAGSLCTADFWATEASLSAVMLAYNLMSLFRQAALKASVHQSHGKEVQHTLQTLRMKLFTKAAFITQSGGKKILHLAVSMRQRQWFEGLWNQSKTFDLPVKFHPIFSP
jgi:Transposase DDE domain group 1